MNELFQEWLPSLIEIFLPVIVALISALVSWMLNSLRKKYDSEVALGIWKRVHIIADIVVRELEHTMVPAVKEAFEDGKLSDKEALKIRELAIDRIMVYLGDKDTARLHKDNDHIRNIIRSVVEAKIHGMHEVPEEHEEIDPE